VDNSAVVSAAKSTTHPAAGRSFVARLAAFWPSSVSRPPDEELLDLLGLDLAELRRGIDMTRGWSLP
jgi:hypothetical protein